MRLTTKRPVWVSVLRTSPHLATEVFKLQSDWEFDHQGVSGTRPATTYPNVEKAHLVFVPWSNVLSIKQDEEDS